MAVRVNIPIYLEVGAELLRPDASTELVAHVATAVSQSLDFMAGELAADGHHRDPVIHGPIVQWTGPGLRGVPISDRSITNARLERAVRQASNAFVARCHAAAAARARDARRADNRVTIDQPIEFRTTPQRFFDKVVRISERQALESRYYDQLELPHAGKVFRVRTHDAMSLDELRPALVHSLDRELHGDAYQYDIAMSRDELAKIVGLDIQRLNKLATAHVSPVSSVNGVILLPANAQLFVACLLLPRIELDDAVVRRSTVHVGVKLRDLAPLALLIDDRAFEAAIGVSWEVYLAEWGDDEIDVAIYPFSVRRRAHQRTLGALLAAEAHTSGSGIEIGGLALLTSAAIQMMPALSLSGYSDSATRALPGTRAGGSWEINWRGAYISAWLGRSDFKAAAARYRPAARKLAPQIVEVLTKTNRAHHELRKLIVSAYGESDAAIDSHTEAFGFLLDALEALPPKNTWLARLYREAPAHDCQKLLVQLAHGTHYKNHPAVVAAANNVAANIAHGSKYRYQPGTGVLFNHGTSDPWFWRYGQVLGEQAEIYLIKSKRVRLKESSKAKIPGWFQTASKRVVERMAAGQTSHEPDRLGALLDFPLTMGLASAALASKRVEPLKPELTGAELMKAVLDEMEKLVGRDDMEEVEVQRSIRLLGVHDSDDHGVTRYRVKFAWVERVPADAASDRGTDDERDGWTTLLEPGGKKSIEELDAHAYGGFEELLVRWQMQQSAIVAQVEIKIVGYAILIFGGVQLGALELAPHALSFIALNLAIYLVKAAFFGGEFSIDGLMLEVVKGYAMALGFGIFSQLGKLAGVVVGEWFTVRAVGGTVARYAMYAAGYLGQRIVSGAITGAGAAAITQLVTDLAMIAMGLKSGLSSWDEYLKSMGWGAVFGVAFEFGGDAFSALGKLESLEAVSGALKRAGWSPAKWWSEINKAHGAMNEWLLKVATNLNGLKIGELLTAFDRAFAELAEAAVDSTKRALLRRIIELSKTELTPLANSGLGKLLDALDHEAAEPLLRALAVQPGRAAMLLETLGVLDEDVVALLASKGQLPVLAESTRLLALLGRRTGVALGVLRRFELAIADADAFLTDLARLPDAAQEQGLELLQLHGRGAPSPALILRALQHPGLRHQGLASLLERLTEAGLANSAMLDELLRALAHADAAALTQLTAAHLQALSEAPQLLSILQRSPQVSWRLLRDVFGSAVGDCESYLARFANASAQHLESVADILLRSGNALPRDVVADLVLKYGPLPRSQIELLDRLHAARVNIAGFLKHRDFALPEFEQKFNEFSRAEQELALKQGDTGRRPNAVLNAMTAARDRRAGAMAADAQGLPHAGGQVIPPRIATSTNYYWLNKKLNDNFISAELHDGVLTVTVKARGHSHLRRGGTELLDDVFKHFGAENIKQFNAEWIFDSSFTSNYDEYAANLHAKAHARNVPVEQLSAAERADAAWDTWTGRQLKWRDFTSVEVPPFDPKRGEVFPVFRKSQ